MSDKISLTHRIPTENSIYKEKTLKEEVKIYLFNYYIFSFRLIKILKLEIILK